MESMREEHTPNYPDRFKGESRGEILLALAILEGEAKFSAIASLVGNKAKSTIDYNLKILERRGLITRRAGGPVRPRHRTTLSWLVNCTEIGYAYFGLLGEKGAREESETETALNILEKDLAIHPEKTVVLSTHRAAATWEGSFRREH